MDEQPTPVPSPVQDIPGQPRAVQDNKYHCDPNIGYMLDTNQTLQLFLEHGVVRSYRRIVKYCEKGRLLCCKNPDRGVLMVNRDSVEQLIGEIKQTEKQEIVVNEDDAPGSPGLPPSVPNSLGQTGADRIIDTLQDVVTTLKDQLKEKDQQIARLFNQQERSDVLLQNLQNKIDRLIQIEAPKTARVADVAVGDPE